MLVMFVLVEFVLVEFVLVEFVFGYVFGLNPVCTVRIIPVLSLLSDSESNLAVCSYFVIKPAILGGVRVLWPPPHWRCERFGIF